MNAGHHASAEEQMNRLGYDVFGGSVLDLRNFCPLFLVRALP